MASFSHSPASSILSPSLGTPSPKYLSYIFTFLETYDIKIACSFWKGYPLGPWESHQPNPVKVLKEGFCMLKTVIKDLITNAKFTGITINIGFIGLNFAGGFSKVNISMIIMYSYAYFLNQYVLNYCLDSGHILYSTRL